MDKNQIAVAIFDKRASEYQNKFMDVNLYSNSFNLFCDSIPKPNADILELACGPGNITRYLLEKRPDFNILGTDLSPNMLVLAQKNNPNTAFQLLDCRDLARLNKKYDAIMCGFGLPYLSKKEAVKLIEDASMLLAPCGVFYLSTMEDDYSKSGFKRGSAGDEMYIHYHEADYLLEALKRSDFEIIDLKRQDFPMPDGTKMTDLVIIAKK